MKRFGASIAAVLAVAALLGGTARASNEWCGDDPVFRTLGAAFSVSTAINASAADVSLISYRVEVPQNARRVAVSYPGGRAIRTSVEIVRDQPAYSGDGSFPVIATVTVSGASGADVVVTAGGATAPASASGTAGTPVTLTFTVSPRGNDQGDDQN